LLAPLERGCVFIHFSYAFEAQKTFITLHLGLPMLQKLLNLINKSRTYGVFGGKGLNVW
jgi:hypothetical protein